VSEDDQSHDSSYSSDLRKKRNSHSGSSPRSGPTENSGPQSEQENTGSEKQSSALSGSENNLNTEAKLEPENAPAEKSSSFSDHMSASVSDFEESVDRFADRKPTAKPLMKSMKENNLSRGNQS